MTKVMTIATDLPPPSPWWVYGVNLRCTVCNGLHKDAVTSDAKSCLFYSANGGAGGAPILRAKNMLKHENVLFKGASRWSIVPKFINELKDNIFPKLGIVDGIDVEKIISNLNYGARKMREEGSKSLNVQVDRGPSEEPTVTKTTSKRMQVSPTKSSLKTTSLKPVVSKRYQERRALKKNF